MEPKDKVELLQIAIKQLIEEEKTKDVKKSPSSSDDSFVAVSADGDEAAAADADHRLLSKLLSQLETLKDDEMAEELDIQNQKVEYSPEVVEKNESADSSSSEMGQEGIVRELKKLRRQNFITHCLLSAMIVLTVAWQVSEVSLILKVKEGFSNPLKTLGCMLTGMMKQRSKITGQEEEKQGTAKPIPLLETSSLPGLKIPDLPHVDIPVFDLVNEE